MTSTPEPFERVEGQRLYGSFLYVTLNGSHDVDGVARALMTAADLIQHHMTDEQLTGCALGAVIARVRPLKAERDGATHVMDWIAQVVPAKEGPEASPE